MGNENNANLNVILGQLEDELLQIKSAKEQVVEVVSSNAELSANLERFIDSSRKLVQQSNTQTKEAAEALSKEVDRLSGCSETIERTSADGVGAINKQASGAQAALEGAANTAVNRISSEAERLSDLSKAMEQNSAETVEAVRKQATDAQATLEQTAGSAVEKASSEISGLTQQAITNLNDGIGEARNDINHAAESLSAATSDAKESRDALLRAHEGASNEHKQQSAETKALLEEAQKYLIDIDARIATLKDIDIDSLVKELRELKDIEATNTAALKKQLTTVTVLAGACVVICLATLAKLFIA